MITIDKHTREFHLERLQDTIKDLNDRAYKARRNKMELVSVEHEAHRIAECCAILYWAQEIKQERVDRRPIDMLE